MVNLFGKIKADTTVRGSCKVVNAMTAAMRYKNISGTLKPMKAGSEPLEPETFRTDGVNTILMRYGKGSISKVPNEINGVSITTIGATAFNYSDVTNVVISEGIEVIE